MSRSYLDDLAARARLRRIEPGSPGPLGARVFGESGPFLVLIHGLGRVAAAWTGLLDALDDEGFAGRIVLVENPGLGASRDVAVPQTTEGHAALIDQTLNNLGLGEERVHVVGLSFGGMIATALAARLGPRALSVAALASSAVETSMFRVTPRALYVNLRGLLPGQELGETMFVPFMASEATRARHPELADELERLQEEAGGGGISAAKKQLVAATLFVLHRHRSDLPERRAVVVGTEDTFVSPSNSRRFAELIEAPLFEFIGAGHDLGIDVPGPLARWLRAWIAGAGETELREVLRT